MACYPSLGKGRRGYVRGFWQNTFFVAYTLQPSLNGLRFADHLLAILNLLRNDERLQYSKYRFWRTRKNTDIHGLISLPATAIWHLIRVLPCTSVSKLGWFWHCLLRLKIAGHLHRHHQFQRSPLECLANAIHIHVDKGRPNGKERA